MSVILDTTSRTKIRFAVKLRTAVAFGCFSLGVAGLLAGMVTIPTKQAAVSCDAIKAEDLAITTPEKKWTRDDAASVQRAATAVRKSNSLLNRWQLERKVTARKKQLRTLMRTDPQAARDMLLADGERNRLAAVTENCVEERTTLQGVFRMEVALTGERRTVTNYTVTSGEDVSPVFGLPETTVPKPGSEVALAGYLLDQEFLLASAGDESVQGIKVLAEPDAANGRFTRPLLILIGDFANTNVNWPTQAMGEATGEHLNRYFSENSYGNVRWDPIGVHADLNASIDRNMSECQNSAVATAFIEAADPLVDFRQYDGGDVIFLAPFPTNSSCMWDGLSGVTPRVYATDDGDVSMAPMWLKTVQSNNDALTVTQNAVDYVLQHEIGHIVNGDGGHAAWADCPAGQSFYDYENCVHLPVNEYGDPYDVMGGSYKVKAPDPANDTYIDYPGGHFTSERKRLLGWFEPEQVVTVTPTSTTQTVDLTPIERTGAGVKMIRIRRSDDTYPWWTVEYRQPLLADGTPSTDDTFSVPYPGLFTGALIHLVSGEHTFLLDATPTPTNDAADPTVRVGQSLTDPSSGATLTVLSQNSDTLRVQITTPDVDLWNPPAPLYVNDGPDADLDETPVGTSLTVSWATVTDLGSGLDHYEYSLFSDQLGEIVPMTSTGTATQVTVNQLTMAPGDTFVASVRTIDRKGKTSSIKSSDGVVVAGGEPSMAPTRTTGASPEAPGTDCLTPPYALNGTDIFRLTWCDSPDAGMNVAGYEYAIGTTPGGTDVLSYTDAGLSTSVSRADLTLVDGLHYFSVRAVGNDGTAGPSTSLNVWNEATVPASVREVRDGVNVDLDVSGSTSEVRANWDPLVHPTPLTYYYQLGTTPGGGEIVSATSVGSNTSFSLSNLDLPDGTRLYVSVVAEDLAGNLGAWRTSDGILLDTGEDLSAPIVAFTAPAVDAMVAGAIDLTATASDDVGVIGVQFEVDGQAIGAELTVAPYSRRWNTGSVSNGIHTIRVTAKDSVRTVTDSRTITVNNASPLYLNAPVVSIMTPTVFTVASDSLDIRFVAFGTRNPPSTWSVYIDGKTVLGPTTVNSNVTTVWQLDTTTIPNGIRRLKFSGYDSVGNAGTSMAAVFIINNGLNDVSPPSAITDLRLE